MDYLLKNWYTAVIIVGVLAVIYFGCQSPAKSAFGALNKLEHNVLLNNSSFSGSLNNNSSEHLDNTEHFGRHRWGRPYRNWGWGRYHPAYVPGIYNGYIPDYDFLPIIPNGVQQCIDGDSLRPCWTIRDGVVTIMQ